MKKVMFVNKPESNARGQYNFSDDISSPFNPLESNGVPRRYDKFSDKDLYTTSIDNNLNKDIIEGGLQYNKNSYFNIDKLKIENAGVNHDVTRIVTNVYLVDKASLNDQTLADGDGNTTYTSVIDALTKTTGTQKIFSHNRGENEVDKGQPLGDIMSDANILSNLFNINDGEGPDYNANWSHAVTTWDYGESFAGEASIELNPSHILNFSGQTIYIIVYTSGDEEISWWPDNDRRNRIHVFEIDTPNDLINPDNGGGITRLQFEYADGLVLEGGGGGAPAWKVTDLIVTVNTTPDSLSVNYNPPEVYHPITGSVTPPVSVELGKTFNSQVLQINPSAQIKSTDNKYDYFPVSEVNILNTNYNLQNYYISDVERQVASAPTQVELDFFISNRYAADGSELIPINPSLGHLFYILSWNDVDNKFKIWDDVISDIPSNENEIIKKQNEDNLYIFNDIGKPLINNYKTPGIKTIKSVMFSYDTTDNRIEPVRWKFITTRIFLDIPLNQYPDFSEVGGADYTTIPWPHTTPIIGGTDENSKYKISVQDTLSGGKIGNQDIIDQTFLINDDENDELGQSIRKFDLEQVRYFNSSYDMTSLLGISIIGEAATSTVEIISPKIQDLPGYEDFQEPHGGQGSAETPIRAYQNPDNGGPGLDVSAAARYCSDAGYTGIDMGQTMQHLSTHSTINDSYIPYYFLHPGAGWTFVNEVLVSDVGSDLEVFGRIFCNAPGGIDFTPYNHVNPDGTPYWDGETNSFSEETSVGEIFISDNSDATLKQDCKLELNCGNLTGKSIVDSSGNSNKGLLIGDYKIKKTRKNRPMRRDSFIKIPKKNDNSNGAL